LPNITSGTLSVVADTVVIDCPNDPFAYFTFTGTYTGATVVYEGTADGGVTWASVATYRLDSGGGIPASTTALGSSSTWNFFSVIGAFRRFRIRLSAISTGAISVSLVTSSAGAPPAPVVAVSGSSSAATLADAFANGSESHMASEGFVFNGTTWDRARSNVSAVAVDTSAARTTTGNGTTATNFNHRGAHIFVNVTAASGTTPTLVLRVQGSVDGTNFYDLDATNAVTASLTTTGTAVIKVYPGLTPAVGSSNQALPRVWRLAWVIGGTTPSFTFTTTASYIL
jgi:hypothetical protein